MEGSIECVIECSMEGSMAASRDILPPTCLLGCLATSVQVLSVSTVGIRRGPPKESRSIDYWNPHLDMLVAGQAF